MVCSLRILLLLILPIVLAGSSCLPLYAQGALPTLQKGTMPRKASDLVHSVGVNTHFGYTDTQYARYEELLKPRLLELGVKHFRDGTFSPEVVEKYKEMGRHGLQLLLITRSDRAVTQARQLGSMLFGLEGVNEPDNGDRSGWEALLRAEQQALYTAVKSDSATRRLPVVVSSLANIRSSPGKLGNLEPWLDFGNMHPYAAGQPPSLHWGWGMTMQAAIYHPRLIFVYFNRGIVRSYKYEFLDLKPDTGYSDMECHFGLIRSDGTPAGAVSGGFGLRHCHPKRSYGSLCEGYASLEEALYPNPIRTQSLCRPSFFAYTAKGFAARIVWRGGYCENK